MGRSGNRFTASVHCPNVCVPLADSVMMQLDGLQCSTLPLRRRAPLADSVMKQLDGLKSVADVRVPIRKFLKDGLESMGPAGEGGEREGRYPHLESMGPAGEGGRGGQVSTLGRYPHLEIMGPAGEGVRGGPPFIRPSGHRPVSPCL